MRKQTTTKKLSTPGEGELLGNLVDYIGGTKTEFCSRVGITTAWLSKLRKRKILNGKLKKSIYKEYGIPDEYWSGDYVLPVKKGLPQKNLSDLGSPVEDLQRALKERDQLIIELQNELIRLYKESKSKEK